MRPGTADADVRHLGVLVGDPNARRIVAVSSAALFEDRALPRAFWDVDEAAIDVGVQGHMYTRAGDVLVVSIPGEDPAIPLMVLRAIQVNREIWRSRAGIELSSAESPLILASARRAAAPRPLPANVTWHVGSLLDAAASRYRTSGDACLAFVLNTRVADALGLGAAGREVLMARARATSLLMDKNVAMEALQDSGVPCAPTYPVNSERELEATLRRIPASGRYVFKPAGGAAGIGLHGNEGGAKFDEIRAHLRELCRADRLPRRFQIQEFLRGPLHGITASFGTEGAFDVLEVHQQTVNGAGRFTGGSWTPALQAGLAETAVRLCQSLAGIVHPRLSGLIGLDVIDGRVIEVNPRLTASAPIAHLIRRQDQLAHHLGTGFQLERIDLDTRVPIPYCLMAGGAVASVIEDIWQEHGALVLPQGLNPFGDTRVVVVNDSPDGAARRTFMLRLSA